MLEYLEPSKSEQTKIILECKQISSNSFKNKITDELIIYKSDE